MLFVIVSALSTESEQPYRVGDELAFNFIVEGRIGAEAGTVVDFQKHWPAEIVKHYVKSEDLKAQRILKVVRLARPVGVTEGWLRAY